MGHYDGVSAIQNQAQPIYGDMELVYNKWLGKHNHNQSHTRSHTLAITLRRV